MSAGKNNGLKYAFYGSGHFASRCLDLLSDWLPPEWIVTAPPKEAGRGKKLKATPVSQFVGGDERFAGIPVIETASASKDEAVLSMKRREPVDFSFVIDFGQIVREPILEWESPVGCLNIHPSLLPRYRGAAPVQRALMDCLDATGVTVFKLAGGVDSGPVLLQCDVDIYPDDDAGSLMERCAYEGVRAFLEYAGRTSFDDWSFKDQDESSATYAPKISPDEERIDWRADAREIRGRIRALSPRPCAWTTIGEKRMRIIFAELAVSSNMAAGSKPALQPGEIALEGREPMVGTGNGALRLKCVQMEGKKIQDAAQWWNGFRAAEGAFFV